MIFTEKFVYVHMPKTGGTFVTQALKTIYRDKPVSRIHLASVPVPTRRSIDNKAWQQLLACRQ